jgi:4-amino-4-deoxychorismate lyase
MNSQLFIETMRVVDGRIANLQDHLNRMHSTVKETFGKDIQFVQLQELPVPTDAEKCRIVYGEHIQTIDFSSYTPRQIRSLQLVEADDALDYHLKYADRGSLNRLAEQRAECDDILIVKDGHITDTSFSNVVFSDGTQLVTPTTYLLPGTMRSRLLSDGLITEAEITVNDIGRFRSVALINAMLPLHRIPFIPIENIHPLKSI